MGCLYLNSLNIQLAVLAKLNYHCILIPTYCRLYLQLVHAAFFAWSTGIRNATYRYVENCILRSIHLVCKLPGPYSQCCYAGLLEAMIETCVGKNIANSTGTAAEGKQPGTVTATSYWRTCPSAERSVVAAVVRLNYLLLQTLVRLQQKSKNVNNKQLVRIVY